MSKKIYRLAYKKMKGTYEYIGLEFLPFFREVNLDPNMVQDIDKFTTSNFENQKELIEYLVKNAKVLQLKEADQADHLEGIINSYLSNAIDSSKSSVSIRRQVSEIAKSVGIKSSVKARLKESASEVSVYSRQEAIINTFINAIREQINNNSEIDIILKTDLIIYLEKHNLPHEIILKLTEYAKKYKPTYEIETGFPLEVVCIEPKPKSPKTITWSLDGGIAYINDGSFLSVGQLKIILQEAVNKPDYGLLYKLLTRYEYRTKENSTLSSLYLDALRTLKRYLELRKEKLPYELKYPHYAINKFIELESINQHKRIDDENNINYLGLRKLGLFVSHNISYDTLKREHTLDERLRELQLKKPYEQIKKDKQMSLFDGL